MTNVPLHPLKLFRDDYTDISTHTKLDRNTLVYIIQIFKKFTFSYISEKLSKNI